MWRCDRIFLSPATAIDSCLLVSISVVQIETTFSTAHLHQSALVQVLHNLLDGVDYFTCTNILASCPRSVGAERLHSTRRREGGGVHAEKHMQQSTVGLGMGVRENVKY